MVPELAMICYCALLLLSSFVVASTESSGFSEIISHQTGEDQMLSMSKSDVNDLKGRHLLVVPWPQVNDLNLKSSFCMNAAGTER